MLHERTRSFEALLSLLDAVCIAVAFGIAILLRHSHQSVPLLGGIPSLPWAAEGAGRSDYVLLLIVTLLTWTAYLRRSRLYTGGGVHRVRPIFTVYAKALALSVFTTGAVVFGLKIDVSRLFFGYFFAVQFGLLLVKQLLVVSGLRKMRSRDDRCHRSLVIGAARPVRWLAAVLGSTHLAGGWIRMLLTDVAPHDPVLRETGAGTLNDLDAVLENELIDEVFIVGSVQDMARLAPTAQYLVERGCPVSLVSTLAGGADGIRGRITHLNGVPMISFGPMPRDEIQSTLRRVIDIAVAAAVLVVSAPLFAVIGALIKLADRGPIFFVQDRLGRGGRPFRLYKFRTMRVGADELLRADVNLYCRYVENNYKLPEGDDPRILALGRFLRKTSLDELPQLWNVLRGHMTLVGPRPIVPEEIREYNPYAELLLSVRPGLTGHWQVEGRSCVPYPQRAYMELDYVAGNSIGRDLGIIARTVPAVLKRKGAY